MTERLMVVDDLNIVKDKPKVMTKEFTFVPQFVPRHDVAARELCIFTVRSHTARQVHASKLPKFKKTAKAGTQSKKDDMAHSPTATVTHALPQFAPGPKDYKLTGTNNGDEATSPPYRRRRRRQQPNKFRIDAHSSKIAMSPPGHLQPSRRVQHSTPRPSVYAEGFLGLRIDPFRCLEHGADDREASLTIDWYITNVSATYDVSCYVFNVTNFYAQFLSTMSDDSFYHAGLSVVRYMYEQLRQPDSSPSHVVLKHRGIAIAKVRERLMSSPTNLIDDLTIYSIIFLCLLERSMENLTAHKLHKDTLATIIANSGGLKSMPDGSILKACLMQFDTAWSLETGESIASRSDVQTMSSNAGNTATDSGNLPESLQNLYKKSGLPETGLDTLYRAHKITNMARKTRNDFICQSRTAPRKYNDFREANPCLNHSAEGKYTELGRLLSFTMVVYCYTAFGMHSFPIALRAARAELTRRLPRYSVCSPDEDEAVVWMWSLAINAWAIGDALQPPGVLLMDQLQSGRPVPLTGSKIVEIGNRYLWTTDLTNSVSKYWTKFP